MPGSKIQNAIGLPFPATLPRDADVDAAAVAERVLALFDETGPGLRRYVGSFRLGAAATEDIVQEVFLALFRHLSLGRPDSNLKGWLFQVAHNLARKQQTRALRRTRVEDPWDALAVERALDGTPDPEAQLASRERRRTLSTVLRGLPERDRQCVALRAEGLSYRDIAKALGISLGSVAKSLVRAISRLMAVDTE